MSTLNVSNITDGTDTVETSYVLNGSAKAWVYFDGAGTPSIKDSLNTSTITDNGTGDYNTNWTNAFSSGSYAVATIIRHNTLSGVQDGTYIFSTYTRFRSLQSSGASQDNNINGGACFGDLA